ncbi:uncharacterized protein N0V89_010138 [Didymosphaeria variabile]|uniref:SGNH hydrolase-type esterase domain-containing protein n=1 Tax=Didymosphaeria variabile TaxID=1932322 RepID=A0A9W8XF49_9PLEO|nr:uncharacterized protein N0V89_010138 [Didymosphaeria variabile]KAJ4348760.1 hypothetical protein N0V89_010138 [Didymosphaeria variabile]
MSRVLEPRNLRIPPKLSSTKLIRASKPKDEYTPHAPPVRWVALGDSYTAGPGAGNSFDGSGCLRTEGSYAAKLEADFPFDVENRLNFLACTGHRIPNVLENQIPELSDNKDERTDFVVMTIGGNDIEFGPLVRICALGIKVPFIGRDCAQQMEATHAILDSQDFYDKMWNLYDKIFEKLDLDNPEEYYQVYHFQYPHPLIESDAGAGGWCNDKSFYDECSFPPPTEGLKLTASLRWDLDNVVDRLNRRILKIADAYVKDKQNNENGHAPGWFRNRLFVLSPSFLDHHFCYEHFSTFDDPEIYIQPYCDRAKGESYNDVTATLDYFNMDPDNCNSTAQYNDDDTYIYSCQVAIAKKYHPAELPTSTRMALPEALAKVFHPRPNGFDVSKSLLSGSLKWHRPRMSHKQDEVCEAPKIDLPSTVVVVDAGDRPDDFAYCPGEGYQEPEPEPEPEEPSGPTKSLSIVAEYRNGDILDLTKIHWKFFQVDYGKAAGCDDEPVREEIRDRVDLDGTTLNYPGGTFDLKLWDQDCQYKNQGDNQGKLYCGDQSHECLDDPADKNPSDINADKGIYKCADDTQTREPVFLCSW